jgi:hypothetical protein
MEKRDLFPFAIHHLLFTAFSDFSLDTAKGFRLVCAVVSVPGTPNIRPRMFDLQALQQCVFCCPR